MVSITFDLKNQTDLTERFYKGGVELKLHLNAAPTQDALVTVATPRAVDYVDTNEVGDGVTPGAGQLPATGAPPFARGTVPIIELAQFWVRTTDPVDTTYTVDIESPPGSFEGGTLGRRLADSDWATNNQELRLYLWDNRGLTTGLAFHNSNSGGTGPSLTATGDTVTFTDRFTGISVPPSGVSRMDSSPISGRKSLRETWIEDGFRGILVDPEDYDPPEIPEDRSISGDEGVEEF